MECLRACTDRPDRYWHSFCSSVLDTKCITPIEGPPLPGLPKDHERRGRVQQDTLGCVLPSEEG
jgi:hypothetical protein